MTRTPTSRWAVATPATPRGARLGLGMTVWSWHRHWWQAYAEILSGRPYPASWRVVSAKTLDTSWDKFQGQCGTPVERVIDLWNSNGGWIPGAAHTELADALGVDATRLTHYDHEQRKRIQGEL